MNIYYLSDNMARLAPTTGSIRHVLSNRTYKEVRCPVDSIHMYTDGHPNEGRIVSSVVRYSKYKIQLACQKLGIWQDVKEAIALSGFQDSWNNIVDICSDNQELQKALPAIRELFGSELVDRVLSESVA